MNVADAFKLNGTYLVTGASGDIGRGIMGAIRAAGGSAVGWDRTRSQNVDVVDVTSSRDVDAALCALEAEADIAGLVLAAGIIGTRSDFLDLTEAEWRDVLDVNLWGTFNVLQRWARGRARAKLPGSAVCIASINAKVAPEGNPHYVASKGGVDALTRSAAVSLARHRIRVNAVAPGPIATQLNAGRWATEEGRDALYRGVVLKNIGTPEDIGHSTVYLLSDAAAWTTGTTIYVDGGVTVAR